MDQPMTIVSTAGTNKWLKVLDPRTQSRAMVTELRQRLTS